jgi:hypothetical protein
MWEWIDLELYERTGVIHIMTQEEFMAENERDPEDDPGYSPFDRENSTDTPNGDWSRPEKKKIIWRNMKKAGEETGASSVSESGSLHFYSFFSYDQFEDHLFIKVRCAIDGDTIDMRFFESAEEALKWLGEELKEAVRVNLEGGEPK